MVKRAVFLVGLKSWGWGSFPPFQFRGEGSADFIFMGARIFLIQVKGWQPMSNSWPTSNQPDAVRVLGRRRTASNRQGKICTQSCSKVGQLLGNSSPTPHPMVTVGFLYGAGAETLILVTGTSGKYPKLFGSRQKKPKSAVDTQKNKKHGCLGIQGEIQTSAVDTRTAVWVSTAEKFSTVLGKKVGIFLECLGGSQRQLCIKTRPLHGK